jgi:serine/threonine protein kinase
MELCPQCGAELDDTGLCGMCLLGGALQTEPTIAATSATRAMTEGMPGGSQSALEYDDFGNYQIQRVLGQGGMGTVYLAQQIAPLHRMVALKVVKLGMDISQVPSRFNYERQAVAQTDHPNIARVYDACATQKGRPYFVMEYVDGIPITTYCDQHRLNTLERLRLFMPVCEAVQHAHQKVVIHRDIEPSNVLVTEVSGQPLAKVIDFGIAQAMDQAGAEGATLNMLTQLGQFVGTPEYMSLEQADVMAGSVDATSDVYSLGVLLYELLAGAVPFDGATLRKAGVAELLRIIREDEAPAMPAKLTGMGASANTLTVGTKLQMKQADASGDAGCRYLAPADAADTNSRYACRGMSMYAFAALWPRLRGTPCSAVVDKTELKGLWNFDMKWPRSAATQGAGDEIKSSYNNRRTPLIEKQD